MKELLFKRKKRFVIFFAACFLPVLGSLLMNASFALLLGSIQIGRMDYFLKVFGVAVLFSLMEAGLFVLSRFMRIGYMRDTILDVRKMAFDKVLMSSYEAFSKKSKDYYMSNLINDINQFEQFFFYRLLNVIFRGGLYLASICILLFIQIKFALCIIGISILVFLISKKFEGRTVKLQQQVSENNEDFTVNIANTVSGLEILKLNRVEDRFLLQSLKAVDQVERKKFHYTVFTEGQRSMTRFITNFAFIGILIYLMNLAFVGVSITKITFMLQLANSSIWPISMVLPLFNELKASISIFEKLTKPEKNEGLNAVEIPPTEKFSFQLEILAENLKFSYDGKEILRGASFKIQKGKKYLIKGVSGAGKSTLIKLLSKAYTQYDGMISMDGMDLRRVKEASFNEHIAFIYQEVFLFEDTIRNNIALFREHTQEEIRDALEKSGLTELVDSREQGLEEVLLENGRNLSGGQRQRISIARAILKKADLLFVDEGTSGLHEELGRAIEAAILSVDSTVIAISHRYYEGVSEKYDYVLELRNGSITQYTGDEYFREVAV